MADLTPQALRQLIAGGETNQVELKIGPPRPSELAERICGLVNAQGGYIIIGVQDATLKLVGVNDPAAAIDTILRATRQLQPTIALSSVEPQIFTLDGKKIVVASVPPSEGPVYQAGGVFWVRRSTHTIPLNYAEIQTLGYERGAISWELLPARNATLETLDLDKVREYLTRRTSRRQLLNRLENPQEVLVALGCAIKNPQDEIQPTNAGLLFFGSEPQVQLPQSEVVCVLFKDEIGVGGYLDRKIVWGNLKELIDQTEQFLQEHLVVGAKIEGWKRVDLPEYPVEALREAVVNAIIHRDYSKEGEVVRVFKYSNRIEVRSPGALLPGITIDLMQKGLVGSKLRNQVLGNLLRDLPGYFERIGSGIRFMLEETRQMGMSLPQFRETGEFVVTFYKNPRLNPDQGAPGAQPLEYPPLSEGRETQTNSAGQLETAGASKEQRQRQRQAMQYIQQNGSITNGEYSRLNQVSDRTALRDLENLVNEGALRRTGNRRSSRYELPK
jgi:ATP-dependent DNA helicase RecG